MKKPLLLTWIIFIIFLSYDTVAQKTVQLKEVKIGDRIWTLENLNVDKFRNGEPIPHAKTEDEWYEATEQKKPAWCYYNNDPANAAKYGKLYNWHAVNDPRGLAPEGWRIPKSEDWNNLIKQYGVNNAINFKSSIGWQDVNGDNKSGFTAYPGGYRNGLGGFKYLEKAGIWWSSDNKTYKEDNAIVFALYYNLAECTLEPYPQNNGLSVRCIKE